MTREHPLFPIALNLQGKPCLVVGGGAVAARKTRSLLESGAAVTVVSPELSPEIQELEARCTIHRREFAESDCTGQRLVFACTSSRAVNETIAEAAAAAGAWCNAADSGESDFHVMAAIQSGPVTVGISTGGGSPALARHLKERLAETVGPEYGALAELLAARRAALPGKVAEQGERADLWRAILASNALDLLREGRPADAECLIDEILRKL